METQRNKVEREILSLTEKHIILELPTSFGKSKLALDLLNSRHVEGKILIVVPKLILIQNWKDEIAKWNYSSILKRVTFVTYVSLPKMTGHWDFIIFDEAHHLSERCLCALREFTIDNSVLLSATLKRDKKRDISALFRTNYRFYSVSIKEAIKEETLPDPKVILYPLSLNNDKRDRSFTIKRPNAKTTIECTFYDRFKMMNKFRVANIKVVCSAREYYVYKSNVIDGHKRKYMRNRNPMFKNIWLHACGERLKWLSVEKQDFVRNLLSKYSKERTLTFCSSIDQAEYLGKHCITSKNKESENILDLFNTKKINHITACNMLDEGLNLRDCRIGIYATLSSSEIRIKQRLGRILRHKDPLIIIPYYRNTRDEEIVKDMLKDYNPDLIQIVDG